MASIARVPSLRCLTVSGLRAHGLDVLRGLPRLEMLRCHGASLRDVSAVSRMTTLRVLHLDVGAAGAIPDLSGLPELHTLTIHSDLKALPTLEPVAGATGVRHLGLHVGRVVDGSLAPVAALSGLRTLRVDTNRFPIEEFARLAARLPHTEGPHRAPFVDPRWSFHGRYDRCRRCGSPGGLETLGKPRRLLCPACDDAAIRKHVIRWEACLSQAR